MSKPSIHLVKWWKSYQPVSGQMTRTLSPFQQDIITPLFRHMPENAVRRFTDNVLDVAPSVILGVSVIYWANSTFAAEQKKHRF
eukprot:snap_masked-scaffold_148-processed-gene-0.2-mRNA-1 protein AED:0.06 eAED:0.16 QI:0/-1/0/1/-1/1/1/0/83